MDSYFTESKSRILVRGLVGKQSGWYAYPDGQPAEFE